MTDMAADIPPDARLLVDIATRFRSERARLGLSMERLARVIDVSCESVRRWENGQALPRIDALLRARQGGMDIVFVLTGQREPGRENATL